MVNTTNNQGSNMPYQYQGQYQVPYNTYGRSQQGKEQQRDASGWADNNYQGGTQGFYGQRQQTAEEYWQRLAGGLHAGSGAYSDMAHIPGRDPHPGSGNGGNIEYTGGSATFDETHQGPQYQDENGNWIQYPPGTPDPNAGNNSGVLGPVIGGQDPGGPMPPGGAPGGAPPYNQGNAGQSPWTPLNPPGQPGMMNPGAMPPPPMPGAPGGYQVGDGTMFGGQSTVNPQAQRADYGSVQGFADQAYDQSMRYLQPQMDQQNRRFDQELINQGIDPNSAAGQEALASMQRGQNDQMNAASFGALQFGQQMQDQMFGQDLQRSNLASQNQANRWGAQGNLFGTQAGMYGNQLGFLGSNYGNQIAGQGNYNNAMAGMYGDDLRFTLGSGELERARQQQDWGQVMDMEANRQWGANFNRQGEQWRTNLALNLANRGNVPYPGMPTPNNPTRSGQPYSDLGTSIDGWPQRNQGGGT